MLFSPAGASCLMTPWRQLLWKLRPGNCDCLGRVLKVWQTCYSEEPALPAPPCRPTVGASCLKPCRWHAGKLMAC